MIYLLLRINRKMQLENEVYSSLIYFSAERIYVHMYSHNTTYSDCWICTILYAWKGTNSINILKRCMEMKII